MGGVLFRDLPKIFMEGRRVVNVGDGQIVLDRFLVVGVEYNFVHVLGYVILALSGLGYGTCSYGLFLASGQ